MRISVLTAFVISGLVSSTPTVAEDKVETGTIKNYECGDNCYLTITTAKGEELTALCVADECVPWNEQTAMPEDMIGKKIEVTVGTGKQYDGDGNDMGEFASFTKLVFVTN
jgi:hypothetical protein